MFSLIFTGILLTILSILIWFPYLILKEMIRRPMLKIFGVNLYTNKERERLKLIVDPYPGLNPTIEDVRKITEDFISGRPIKYAPTDTTFQRVSDLINGKTTEIKETPKSRKEKYLDFLKNNA